MLLLPGDEFVVAFCRINLVRNGDLMENSKRAFHNLETRAPSRNTSDPPTPFQCKCNNHAKGCTFTTKIKTKDKNIADRLIKFKTRLVLSPPHPRTTWTRRW
ncbi:hypothetical protein V1525DRAFT_210486 [Lipomyces kononenkoae]|uniref:Uncharacterized protein n=1 Tax=Lipomyces kononenkoae TaxID=34357 RepID=A0ACC3SY36_LIPKO